MSVKDACKCVLAASAVMVGVIGLLVSPPPARAAFDCASPAQPIFDGSFNLRQANGFRVETNLSGESAEGQAVAIGANGSRNNGRVKGSTLSGSVLLEIRWDGGAYAVYTGSWDANGFVHGTSYDATRARVPQTTWDSEAPLGCRHPPEVFTFAAVAYEPIRHMVGMSKGFPSQEAAIGAAMDKCQEYGDVCRIEGSVKNGCIVIAVMDTGPFFVGTGATQEEASNKAFRGLPNVIGKPGGLYSCSSDGVPGTAHGTRFQLPDPEITLSYVRNPGFIGMRAVVGITNNENNPPVGCTYKDQINTRPFTVTGSAPTNIDFFGLPTGTTYLITITCDNNLKKEHQEIY